MSDNTTLPGSQPTDSTTSAPPLKPQSSAVPKSLDEVLSSLEKEVDQLTAQKKAEGASDVAPGMPVAPKVGSVPAAPATTPSSILGGSSMAMGSSVPTPLAPKPLVSPPSNVPVTMKVDEKPMFASSSITEHPVGAMDTAKPTIPVSTAPSVTPAHAATMQVPSEPVKKVLPTIRETTPPAATPTSPASGVKKAKKMSGKLLAAMVGFVILLAGTVTTLALLNRSNVGDIRQRATDWCGPDPAGTNYGSPCSTNDSIECGGDGKETKCVNNQWQATGGCCGDQPLTSPPDNSCGGICSPLDSCECVSGRETGNYCSVKAGCSTAGWHPEAGHCTTNAVCGGAVEGDLKCPNDNSKAVTGCYKFVCPQGCSYDRGDSGTEVQAWRCGSNTPGVQVVHIDNPQQCATANLGGQCGQIDMMEGAGNGNFCGYRPADYTCGEARCQTTTTPSPTTSTSPSPSLSPSPTPGTSPSPNMPMCTGSMSRSIAIPAVGDDVAFNCANPGAPAGVTSYQFRYALQEGTTINWINIPVTNTSFIRTSDKIHISQPGTYTVQCRPCIGSSCANWGP